MYHHLRGKLVATGPMEAVVEVGGVGYQVRVPLSTLEAIKGREEVLLYTHLVVREDALRLFGFATIEERRLFELVLSVSGVGPTLALAALSAQRVDELEGALAAGDVARIRRIKGIGKRLAERLVVELKDRMAAARGFDGAARPAAADSVAAAEDRASLEEAAAALVALGFTPKDAEGRVAAAYRRLVESDEEPPIDTSTEGIIREALR